MKQSSWAYMLNLPNDELINKLKQTIWFGNKKFTLIFLYALGKTFSRSSTLRSHNTSQRREVYYMKFPKLPNSCFRNDVIIDRLLGLF